MNPHVLCQHFQDLGVGTPCSNQLFPTLLPFILHLTARLIFQSSSCVPLWVINLQRLPLAYSVEYKLFSLAKVPEIRILMPVFPPKATVIKELL